MSKSSLNRSTGAWNGCDTGGIGDDRLDLLRPALVGEVSSRLRLGNALCCPED